MTDSQTLLCDEQDALFSKITELRVSQPDLVTREAAARSRREELAPDGKLVILAADHPGRGVTASSENPSAMANRRDYLTRIVDVLQVEGIDGVMATPDILEELLLLNHLFRNAGRRAFLDHKLMVASMNRGGLAGSIFEMMDRFTGPAADQISRMGYDGAKMMFRLDSDNPESGATIADCAQALRQLDALDLPAFLEPLPVRRETTGYKVVKDALQLARVIGIASALGNSSRRLWLKIPYVEHYQLALQATTCPVLMLGGEARGNPSALLHDFAAGMAAAPNVRGVLVGRNILYPGKSAPSKMAEAVVAVIHGGLAPSEAARIADQEK